MSDATDDPVVREIPVHLADILRGSIHVVQFPLRPVYRPMTSRPVHAEYKPVNSMLTLDYPVHTEDHYNKDDDMDMPSRMTLQSSAIAPVSNYAVGVFRDGQLHLTPVTSILQMRPTMSHLDDEDEKDDNDMDVSTPVAPTSAAAPEEVQVQVVKRQSERALAAMQNSYAYKRSVIQSEKWMDLTINPTEEDEFEQLFSDVEVPVPFDVTPQAYLNALSYRQDEPDAVSVATAMDNKAADTGLNSTGNMNKSASLDDRVLAVLQTYKVLHFNQLCELLPLESRHEIHAALPRVATIVRGCVVAKSSRLPDHPDFRAAIVAEVRPTA
ncbi:hypothetical protein DYB32_006622 [Aphanomyces invadans]|uniref:DNA-directed RNA polymerase III subunit RPC5 n=1 Tax=Aphanomyces invadans TaxID=157072 RepID=A0A3R6YWF1_9STRA|nr:hypothetical protein DYB32_006622 [Aphanomyces invadans]